MLQTGLTKDELNGLKWSIFLQMAISSIDCTIMEYEIM